MTTTDRPPIQGFLWLPGALLGAAMLACTAAALLMSASVLQGNRSAWVLGVTALSFFLCAYTVTTGLSFWKRRRRTVVLMVGLAPLCVALVAALETLQWQYEQEPHCGIGGCAPFTPTPFPVDHLAFAVSLALIWAAYFLNSKQVKATFTA